MVRRPFPRIDGYLEAAGPGHDFPRLAGEELPVAEAVEQVAEMIKHDRVGLRSVAGGY